jgi:hypothetical protein
LNAANGAHYGAWIYPDGSAGGANVLRLIKFEAWTTWSFTPMAAVNLPPVGTNWHTLALTFQSTNISVTFDGSQLINASDNDFDSVPPYVSGGITADMYSGGSAYNLLVDDILVTTPVSATPPTITSQPNPVTANAGSTVMFSVTATGTAPLSYHWFKNGSTGLTDAGNISGSATRTLALANIAASDTGDYSVVISNQAGTVTSSAAKLTVITSTPPTIVSQPRSQTVIAGQSASFSVSATGTAPLHFQWRKNGANIAGATASAYTLANAQPANAGQYTVAVSNNGGVATSAPATLAVNYTLLVTTSSGGSVSIQPSQSSYAPGTTVTLKAAPSLLFKFTGWSGNATGTANPLTITMNGNKQIKANFALLGLLGLP